MVEHALRRRALFHRPGEFPGRQAGERGQHIVPGGSDHNYRVYAVRGRARVHGAPDEESSHPPILAPASVTPSPTHLSPEPTAVDTAPTPQPSVRACTARARKPRAPARKARGRRRACARRAGRGYARRRSCREWHLPMHLFDPTDVAHAVALAPPDARAHALPYEPGPGDATPTHTPKGGGGVSKGTAMHDDHLFFLLD